VLVRRHAAVLRDLSAAGCLLELGTPIATGAIGVLEIDVDGCTCIEVFRVCWSRPMVASEPRCHAGVEFLPIAPAGPQSIRTLVARLESQEDAAGGTKSGGFQTFDREAVVVVADDEEENR
jgi:hypothetical protein